MQIILILAAVFLLAVVVIIITQTPITLDQGVYSGCDAMIKAKHHRHFMQTVTLNGLFDPNTSTELYQYTTKSGEVGIVATDEIQIL